MIRTGTASDAASAAQLHAEQIADGFLTFLGTPFLTRLYRRISLSPNSFVLVAEDGEVIVGFVAGSSDVGALYRSFLWHDGFQSALGAAGRILRSWRRVLETLRHGSTGDDSTGHGIELLAIAVDPTQQGRGVGGRLVSSFLQQVESNQEHAAYVVVAANNAAAIGLYQRAGFRSERDFELHAGTNSLLMQWDQNPAADLSFKDPP